MRFDVPRGHQLGDYLPAEVAAPRGHRTFHRTPTVTSLMDIPEGPAGTVATLGIMRDLVRKSVTARDPIVRSKAVELAKLVPNRDFAAQARMLHAFVRDTIIYVKDPVDVEHLATPEKVLELGAGDCDEQATLLAALLTAIGHPARFVALGFNGLPFSHVLVETRVGGRWVCAETIIDVPFGWCPPGVTSRYQRDI